MGSCTPGSGMSRRLFGLFVAANADGPFIRVKAAHSFGEFLVADDAADSLFHSRHPTWLLKVGIMRLRYRLCESAINCKNRMAGSFPRPGRTRVKLAREFSTYELKDRCPVNRLSGDQSGRIWDRAKARKDNELAERGQRR
jgi:hypothetical protein